MNMRKRMTVFLPPPPTEEEIREALSSGSGEELNESERTSRRSSIVESRRGSIPVIRSESAAGSGERLSVAFPARRPSLSPMNALALHRRLSTAGTSGNENLENMMRALENTVISTRRQSMAIQSIGSQLDIIVSPRDGSTSALTSRRTSLAPESFQASKVSLDNLSKSKRAPAPKKRIHLNEEQKQGEIINFKAYILF